MKYLCLIYDNEQKWLTMSEAEQGQIFGAHMAFTEEAKKAGKMVGGEALQPSRTATVVRLNNNKAVHKDGPYAETKEQLGGYYILDCENLDDALAWAAKIPEASSGAIEVRPIMVFE